MNMFQNIGEFTPDSLIVSNEFPILKEGIGLKAAQGILKRGTLIVKTDGAGVIAKTAADSGSVFGILADDVDTGADAGSNVPAVCYITGLFNRGAVVLDAGVTIDSFEGALKEIGIYLRDVQNY